MRNPCRYHQVDSDSPKRERAMRAARALADARGQNRGLESLDLEQNLNNAQKRF